MLKRFAASAWLLFLLPQPPSGGCVLKQFKICFNTQAKAASQPPSGGCVLKHIQIGSITRAFTQPPSGGCVLKLFQKPFYLVNMKLSRLRAAVC